MTSLVWAVYDFWVTFSQVPSYHLLLEGFLFLWVLWLLARRIRNRSKTDKLTKEEEEELLSEWTPEPLVPLVDPDHPALHAPVVESKPGKHMIIDGVKCLNLATHNYLGFAGNSAVESAAIDCMHRFGVGSCGPRAFYGTADVHVHLEEALARYIGTESAVLYSYGFSTIASAIPAYAKKGDVIFADERVNFAIQKALDASRSKVKYFRHNDPDSLLGLLEQQAKEDKKNPKQAKVSRRFLVVEGIYVNTGHICKLDQLIPMKRKFKLRLFIDESVSFGTLGAHGRGITEHLGIALSDVDLIIATLENSIGSIGGFCAGSTYVVEHQTLAGLGYCFSASLPPMLAASALAALKIMEEDEEMFQRLRDNAEVLSDAFDGVPGLELHGDRLSPVKHLVLESKSDKNKMNDVVQRARARGVAITVANYLENAEVFEPPCSIRLTCSTLLDGADIEEAGKIVKEICEEVF